MSDLERRVTEEVGWGASGFRGCKFCRRKRGTINPGFEERQGNPSLRFRSERAAVCNICAAVKRQSFAGEDLGARQRALTNNEEKFQEHMSAVKQKEDELNGLGLSKKRQTKRKPGAPGSAPDGDDDVLVEPTTTIDGETYTSMQAGRVLGILWPEDVYEQREKSKPPKALVQKLVLGGVEYTGVLRDESHGCPIGTIDLTATVAAKTCKKQRNHDSQAALRDGETESVWNNMKKRTLMESKVVPAEGGNLEKLILKPAAPVVKKKSEFDLEEFWDPVIVTSSEKAKTSGAESDVGATSRAGSPPPRKHRRTSAAGSAAGSNSNVQTPKSDGKGTSTTKRGREIDASDHVLLRCTQFFKQFSGAASIGTLTIKSVDSLFTRVSTRLKPELVSMYSEGYDPMKQESDKGMECLEQLRTAKNTLELLRPFIMIFRSTDGEAASG